MVKETGKKDIKLIVSDIDNTLADFFDAWGCTVGKTVKMLSESRGIPEDKIYADIKANTPGGDRFHSNVAYLVKNIPIVQPKNEEERKKFEKDDARIIHTVNKMRIEADKPYKGVMATISKAKASGTKVVFYTDAVQTVAIGRLANMNFPIEMIDGLVTRSDEGDRQPAMQVKGKVYAYREALKEKLGENLVAVGADQWKPNPQIMGDILKRMGVENPKEAVMVGDNVKSDGGGAIAIGMEFAWQKAGAVVSPEANAVYEKINTKPGYQLGVEGHLAQMTDANRPTMVLDGGFSDLNKYCRFVAADNGHNKGKQKDLHGINKNKMKSLDVSIISRRINGHKR